MPVTLVDRLPLPNLKVYTAGSVSLLSIAVYYAVNVTSDPNWRVNASLARQEAPGEEALAANSTRNLTEQFVDVMNFMMQEPLCMWTVINMCYSALAVFGFVVQRAVFGQLRVAEAQRVKDKFWNYVFYKFIFVFGVINVQYMDEVLLWCSWFTLVGFLHLLSQLCKDRYEYLSSSPQTGGWAHVRLGALLGGILLAAGALLGVAAAWGLPAGPDTFTFMAAECVLVLGTALHVCARYVLAARDADAAGPAAYYTHLVFDATLLVVELVHVLHMVVRCNMVVSLASLVLLLQLRHLLHELQARLRRHRLYTELATHMSQNYPMASKEEVDKNQDNCAICWEPMKEARKLPCKHLFHNGCLCRWVQQDASCPTCRRALAAHAPPAQARARAPNHLFHFDGSRYVSWLPSFSVEVTRVREVAPAGGAAGAPGGAPGGPGGPGGALAGEAAALQRVFPQYSLSLLTADLQRTHSAHLTLDNILEGRLTSDIIPEELSPPSMTTVVSPVQLQDADALSPADVSSPATLSVPATMSAPATLSAATSTGDLTLPDHITDRFSSSASEREELLRRRKERLVASARARYLQLAGHAGAHAGHAGAHAGHAGARAAPH